MSALDHLRAIREGLPETSERLSHGAPAFFYRGKRCFLMVMDNHHGDGRLAIWCAAPGGAQELLAGMDPQKFFRPPYVGHRGWLGVSLDGDVDWDEITGIVEDAYATVADRSARLS
jgi:predicted DNA-binding protein (MmcQ/YjbR family)